MIKDYELLQNGSALFAKRLMIWGAGPNGRELAEKLSEYTARIAFIDSDKEKQGPYHERAVYAPEQITQYDKEDIAVILSSNDPMIQEDILKQIAMMGYQDIDTYSKFAVEGALYFLKNSIPGKEEKKDVIDRIPVCEDTDKTLQAEFKLMKEIFMAEMSEKSVYVYQPKKVGSVSLVNSAKAAGVYGVHVHNFLSLGKEKGFLRNIIKRSSGKVITVVREPVARQISLMWHYWGKGSSAFLQQKKVCSLAGLEQLFFSPNNENEFEWFNKEFKKILGIDIYDRPFDRELGYSIIEADGIQILLLKLEKMQSLENVIGRFLEAENFALSKLNIATRKNYRYAYQDYLENVEIPSGFWDHFYIGNKYMDHFYSEDEKKKFYEHWRSHIKDRS